MGAGRRIDIASALRASITEDIEAIITRVLKITKSPPETVDVKSAASLTAVKRLREAVGLVAISFVPEKETDAA